MAAKTAAAPRPGGKKDAADEERGPTTEERFAAFSARYKWYLFIPILAAIVLAIVLAIASAHKKTIRRAAIEADGAARAVEDLDAMARRYRGTFVGDRAHVRAADLLYDQGRYAEARERYTAYLDTGPDPALGMPVRAALVQTYIAEHDYAAAIKACDDTLDKPGREFVEQQVIYYKAYAFELSGDLEEAQNEYRKLLTGADPEQGRSPKWAWLAREREEELNRKLKAQSKKPEKDVDTPGEG